MVTTVRYGKRDCHGPAQVSSPFLWDSLKLEPSQKYPFIQLNRWWRRMTRVGYIASVIFLFRATVVGSILHLVEPMVCQI